MTRAAQNLLMILIGGVVLWITFNGEVLNYVKPGFRWPLAAGAVVLLALGAAGIRRDWHGGHEEDAGHDQHGHQHGHGGPRVAWLLLLPVLAVFAIAPPELGLFTASRADDRPAPPPALMEVRQDDSYALPPGPDPLPMKIGEFMGRSFEAQIGGQATLTDRRVELTGFVVPARNGRGWSVARLQLNCCAADAMTLRVDVLDAPRPAKGSWVKVVGVWQPAGKPDSVGVYRIRAVSVSRTEKPDSAYE